MQWLRLYNEIIDDPKVMRLPEALRWRYVGLLCVVNRTDNGGLLPCDSDIIFSLRLTDFSWKATKTALIKAGLVVENGGELAINGWKSRQYESDNVTMRVKRHRSRNVTETFQKRYGNGDETGQDRYCNTPDTETDTDTETEAETEQTQSGGDGTAPGVFFRKVALIFDQDNLECTRGRLAVLYHARKTVGVGAENILLAAKNLANSNALPAMKHFDYLFDRWKWQERVTLWAIGGPPGAGGKSPPAKAKWQRGMEAWLDKHPEFKEEYGTK